MNTSTTNNNVIITTTSNSSNPCFVSMNPSIHTITNGVSSYYTNDMHKLYLQRTNGSNICTDDIVTRADLLDEDFLWKSLYIALCNKNSEKASEYETLLTIYNKDYHRTVLAIETANAQAQEENNG